MLSKTHHCLPLTCAMGHVRQGQSTSKSCGGGRRPGRARTAGTMAEGIDELVILDITATIEGRRGDWADTIRRGRERAVSSRWRLAGGIRSEGGRRRRAGRGRSGPSQSEHGRTVRPFARHDAPAAPLREPGKSSSRSMQRHRRERGFRGVYSRSGQAAARIAIAVRMGAREGRRIAAPARRSC